MSLAQDAENAAQSLGGQGGQQQGGPQQQSGGGGIDNTVNKDVDQFASKEGVPQGADNTINKGVDQEVNKFA